MEQQIKLYEHVDTICEMVKPKINGRKICVLYFNQNDKATLESKFAKNELTIDYWINESITPPPKMMNLQEALCLKKPMNFTL